MKIKKSGRAKKSETSKTAQASAEVKTKISKSAQVGAEAKTKTTEKEPKQKRAKMSRGGRNLVILGIGATLIALFTTTIGLTIYHVSGDIYLDRSRPGYMPDEAEVEEEAEKEPEEYDFERSGTLTVIVIDEYTQHLQEEIDAIDDYVKPFDAAILSDEQLLGLPKED